VRASYLEIYNEEIRDLLSKNPEQRLELKETPDRGVYVKDLLQFVVKSVSEITSVLQVGLGAWAWEELMQLLRLMQPVSRHNISKEPRAGGVWCTAVHLPCSQS
jgi:hypothetical protein